ncbi:hypothetical protein [Gracilimonas mengyeensis]|uniref:Uncharacterized protein n=1 Tax=Gracilimonas mengyeensis TaxID=1302730 RepID=A0A521DEN3_9BACT|nr:hypothetical protein [Gracilimonas mengyeensis]SMO70058.1 hypothetical protein SAMN06265219_10899 [Gracilimonas mengyeensis]
MKEYKLPEKAQGQESEKAGFSWTGYSASGYAKNQNIIYLLRESAFKWL